MGSGKPEWLRGHTDEELMVLAREMEARSEQFDSGARQLLNDELRRRKLPLISFGSSRY